MKLLFMFLLISLSLNVFAKQFTDIDKIFIFNTKVWHEVKLDSIKDNYIIISKIDTEQIVSILERSKVKKYAFYKPASNSLYGIAFIKDKKYKIRISEDVVFLSCGNNRHHFIKNKEDKKWLKEFIINCNQLINQNTNGHP